MAHPDATPDARASAELRPSVLAMSAPRRLLIVLAPLAFLWLAVFWALR
jgi:hypothetical protein